MPVDTWKDPKNKEYSKDVNLISTTDPSSYITYANSVFCDVAEYQTEELLGQPHNKVRHKEMPKAAFAQLWEYVQSGKSWMGLVKNQRKGDGYYWVSAFVTPIKNHKGDITEYQSVRSRPDEAQTKRASLLYKKLNNGEKIRQNRIAYTSFNIFFSVCFLLQSFLLFTGVPVIYMAVAGLICGSGMLGISLHQNKRFSHIRKLANDSYHNPLMEKPYTGYFDDYSQIELALMMRKAELRAVSGRTAETAGQILEEAENEFGTIQSIEQNLTQQSAETEMVATAVEELSHSIQEVADSAAATSQATREANQESQKGMESISVTIDVIEQLAAELENSREVIDHLSQNSVQIESILDVIGGISEQTNLLALNAAIEAARAGEAGRGFAVVADEVRSLATKSRASTDQIHAMISELQETAQNAVSIMEKGGELSRECTQRANDTGGVLSNISGMLSQITDNSHQIAVAVEQQAGVTQEVNGNVVNIKSLADETLQMSNRSVERTSKLVDSLEALQRLIKQFQSH
ncbi:chemotaxis protein [Vibrio sp. HA2012]|uniref:methyl-accepting chemotaxis protein n=1 Tax=Vibrio sp. HA2012 TaxID=1971595 RepID=UPI000C2CCA36|nr:PAS domain-containing methyl-accepting chemotaxis protein [Vibrio sp. HA2012]PJC85935.1 chemotaxis protein [Vibrio sp. HA2012]